MFWFSTLVHMWLFIFSLFLVGNSRYLEPHGPWSVNSGFGSQAAWLPRGSVYLTKVNNMLCLLFLKKHSFIKTVIHMHFLKLYCLLLKMAEFWNNDKGNNENLLATWWTCVENLGTLLGDTPWNLKGKENSSKRMYISHVCHMEFAIQGR